MLPPPQDDPTRIVVDMQTDEVVKSDPSFPRKRQQWESSKEGLDPPFPLDSVHMMSEPGDSITIPKVVCQNHSIRVALGWAAGAAQLSAWCVVVDDQGNGIKVLGGPKPEDRRFGAAITLNDKVANGTTTKRLSQEAPTDAEILINLANLPPVVESLWITLCAETFDFSKIATIVASIEVVTAGGKVSSRNEIDTGEEIIRYSRPYCTVLFCTILSGCPDVFVGGGVAFVPCRAVS